VFFKPKDLMTVGNISLGMGAVLVSMEGMAAPKEDASTYVFWAGVCILAAFFFDMFDGRIARWLGQMNRFGSEFDNIADLTSYSVAPSFILYLAFRKVAVLPGAGETLRTALAVVLALIPSVCGCIRFARFNVRRLDIPGYWIGFPRPAAALMMVALVNSHLFQGSGVMGWVGAALVVFLGFMNLSLFPYISHHDRRWSWHLKIILNMVWISVVVAFAGGVLLDAMPARTVFDVVLLWLSFYLFVQWTDIPQATREDIARLTADWND